MAGNIIKTAEAFMDLMRYAQNFLKTYKNQRGVEGVIADVADADQFVIDLFADPEFKKKLADSDIKTDNPDQFINMLLFMSVMSTITLKDTAAGNASQIVLNQAIAEKSFERMLDNFFEGKYDQSIAMGFTFLGSELNSFNNIPLINDLINKLPEPIAKRVKQVTSAAQRALSAGNPPFK